MNEIKTRVINWSYDSEVTNILSHIYLDSFRKRQQNCENRSTIFFNYLTLLFCIIDLVKCLLAFVFEFDFETNLILFEFSVFLGGIEKYNRILVMFACLLAICLNIELRLANRSDLTEWTQLFQIRRNRVRHLTVFNNDFDTINRLERATKFVNLFISVSFIITGEFTY